MYMFFEKHLFNAMTMSQQPIWQIARLQQQQ